MEDFEKRAREREREINERKNVDPRDEKGLIKVEDHKNLGRDPDSNAIVNTDRTAYEAYTVSYTHLTLPTKASV